MSVPARICVHFGFDRTPDCSVWSWFSLPLVGLAPAAGLGAFTRWLRSCLGAPGTNVSNKEAILAIPPRCRAPALARVGALISEAGAWAGAAFVLIQAGGLDQGHQR